ncbi:MAG: cobalt-precorrin-6A reductase [Alphaproteobacteria bacterium]
MTTRILILGGTGEARVLAYRFAGRDDLAVTTSMAGRTKSPRVPAGTLRRGGFGGPEGLADFLTDEAIDLLIDATHPFAARISANAARACLVSDVPRLMLVRDPWIAGPGDRWIEATDTEDAARRLAEFPGPIFLAIGRQELAAFAGLGERRFIVRTVDRPAEPLPISNAKVLRGRGPFRLASEKALLAKHEIAVLVVKNAGGERGHAKLVAAAAAGLPVIMIRRPVLPDGERVKTVDAALAWVDERTR